jgi:hypothetical protein
MRKPLLLAALVAALAAGGPALAQDGRNKALITGAAAGVVGGSLLNQALQGPAAAAPAPAPAPVYVEPEPEPVYVQPVARRVDPDYRRMLRLRDKCDMGERRACIRFGIAIGERRERQAQLRRDYPDLFEWE